MFDVMKTKTDAPQTAPGSPPKKPAAKKPETSNDELFKEEVESDPEIARLSEEISKMYRLPRVRELTQVAGQLATTKDFKDDKATGILVARALALWQSCAHRLQQELREEIRWRKDYSVIDEIPEPTEYELLVNYQDEFPLEFERALRVIVGDKVRRADRYKTFRDFARDTFRPHAKDDEALEKLVADKFASLQANGFELNPFERAAKLFKEWKATRASKKASKAAQMRWSKK